MKNNMMENGLELPRKGLIKQERISYEIDESTNMFTKKIHSRKYSADGIDYHDTWNSEPLYSVISVVSLEDNNEKDVPWHPLINNVMGNT